MRRATDDEIRRYNAELVFAHCGHLPLDTFRLLVYIALTGEPRPNPANCLSLLDLAAGGLGRKVSCRCKECDECQANERAVVDALEEAFNFGLVVKVTYPEGKAPAPLLPSPNWELTPLSTWP